MHEQVRKKIENNKATTYKEVINKNCCQVVLEGDHVWYFGQHMKGEAPYTIGTYYKLQQRKMAPCKLQKKINNNEDCISLATDLNIFNVADISPYYEYSTWQEVDH